MDYAPVSVQSCGICTMYDDSYLKSAGILKSRSVVNIRHQDEYDGINNNVYNNGYVFCSKYSDLFVLTIVNF